MAGSYRNDYRGTLICYDRAGKEVRFQPGRTVPADIDTSQLSISKWIEFGMLVDVSDAAQVEAERQAVLAEAERLTAEAEARAAEAQAGTVEIIAGEPRPIA